MNDLDSITFALGLAIWPRERCPECLRPATHAIRFTADGVEEDDYYALCADHIGDAEGMITEWHEGKEVLGVYELPSEANPLTAEKVRLAVNAEIEKEIRQRLIDAAMLGPDAGPLVNHRFAGEADDETEESEPVEAAPRGRG